MLWTAVAVGLVVLAAILIFIAQNSASVRVHFLTADGELPLGVALLFAALLGAILVLARVSWLLESWGMKPQVSSHEQAWLLYYPTHRLGA
jgi:uncharacterized integral membrane protein